MDYKKIVQGILDIGEAMLRCGAEIMRVEDSLYRMCKSYGFVRYDVWVVPSNIQMTVETQDGDVFTQVRHIKYMSTNYDRLDYLNNLSRYVCNNLPDAEQMHEKYLEVMNRPPQHPAIKYIAGVMGGAGFAVFFGSGFADAIVAVIASLAIVAVGSWISKRENNFIVYNAVVAFIAEVIIIGAVSLGFGTHADRITIGIVMLLISALGTTNGIRDFLHADILSGIFNIINSVLGAMGIACGIVVAMLLLPGVEVELFILNSNIVIQLISCTVACTGFAFWFKIKGIQVLYSGIGAFFTWAIYLIVYELNPSNFLATMVGALFVSAYASVMARINKAPATIFLTASVFPLIPGPNLYYMMYGAINQDVKMTYEQGIILLATCVAIAFGFLIVEVANRYMVYLARKSGKIVDTRGGV